MECTLKPAGSCWRKFLLMTFRADEMSCPKCGPALENKVIYLPLVRG